MQGAVDVVRGDLERQPVVLAQEARVLELLFHRGRLWCERTGMCLADVHEYEPDMVPVAGVEFSQPVAGALGDGTGQRAEHEQRGTPVAAEIIVTDRVPVRREQRERRGEVSGPRI